MAVNVRCAIFEERLVRVVEVCYAHPFVQESMGYAGMADKPGWQLIGLNQLEARQPKPTLIPAPTPTPTPIPTPMPTPAPTPMQHQDGLQGLPFVQTLQLLSNG